MKRLNNALFMLSLTLEIFLAKLRKQMHSVNQREISRQIRRSFNTGVNAGVDSAMRAVKDSLMKADGFKVIGVEGTLVKRNAIIESIDSMDFSSMKQPTENEVW